VASNATGSGLSNYNITYSDGTLTVEKADPELIWPTASSIALGQSIGDSTLSGGSSTPLGTFSFESQSYVPTSTGSYLVSLMFTPNDTSNYNTSYTTVYVDVETAVFERITTSAGSRIITLHFNINVTTVDGEVVEPTDFSVFRTRDGIGSSVLVTSANQPSGTSSFNISVASGEEFVAGDVIRVTIKLSGATKIIDLGGNPLQSSPSSSLVRFYPE
jgi:hypothetical protein